MTPDSCVGVQGAAMTLVVVAVNVCVRVCLFVCVWVHACIESVHLMKPHLVGTSVHLGGCAVSRLTDMFFSPILTLPEAPLHCKNLPP